jgi:hypothetical protein
VLSRLSDRHRKSASSQGDRSAGKVTAIRSVIGRQKLRYLAPLADIPALFERRKASLSTPDQP